jgi:hypothetical protein
MAALEKGRGAAAAEPSGLRLVPATEVVPSSHGVVASRSFAPTQFGSSQAEETTRAKPEGPN